jgi:hypothetical protein
MVNADMKCIVILELAEASAAVKPVLKAKEENTGLGANACLFGPVAILVMI